MKLDRHDIISQLVVTVLQSVCPRVGHPVDNIRYSRCSGAQQMWGRFRLVYTHDIALTVRKQVRLLFVITACKQKQIIHFKHFTRARISNVPGIAIGIPTCRLRTRLAG